MNMTCNALESKTMKQEPSTMSGVVVTKASPVVVRPLSPELELGTPPPPHDTVTLSPFDRLVPPIPATSLFVFDRPIDEPAETIRRGLSRALAHYRPFAGRLDGAGGIIACTDDGATFLAASASCPLREATAAALQEMDDLAVLYPGLLCRDADPLLMVQVTEFACGGFVVGVTSNHVVADGAGMSQFLRAVADLARDGVAPPPSRLLFPIRTWDGGALCRSLPVPVLAVPKWPATIQQEPPPRLARLDVVVPYGLIRHIKVGGFGTGGEQCTALDAVMAVLWRCRTRAALSAAESPAPLKFVCNMRTLAGAPAGMSQFLRAVAELARDGVALPPPSPVRAWDGGSCRSLPAPVLVVPKSPATIQHEPPPRLARLDVVVPYGLIRHIKAGGFGAGGEQCTAQDAVMAVLWRCRTRAALSAAGNAAESPAPFKFVVMATAGAVSGGSIGDLVRLIRRAKEKIPDLLISGGGVVAAEDRAPAAAKPVWYEAFSVTDWRYLGLDAIDFGGGAPARVLWHIKRILEPGCVVCPPRRAGAGGDGGDGVDVTSMFVKPEHADAFLGELARLAVSAE
ncbi:unnamed protein product [Urochloa decumbens]|uniref:Uncharacterized protein n=1 Tax=Urochloa decumbens TaxID=240449 RepID=A0ABC9DAS5_9POAL